MAMLINARSVRRCEYECCGDHYNGKDDKKRERRTVKRRERSKWKHEVR